MGLQELVLGLQLLQAPLELALYRLDGPFHGFVAGHVVSGGENDQLFELLAEVARESVVTADSLHLVTEQLDPDPQLLIGRVKLDGVASGPETSASEHMVVTGVVELDQPAKELALVDHVTGPDHEDPVLVLLG